MKIINFLFTLSFLSLSSNATLIDTDNNSFIDDTSSLEWMDFGINNGISYDTVKNLLGENEVYEGWRLANERDILGLWMNTFGDISEGFKNLNHYGNGFGRVDQANDINGNSTIESIFAVVGFNTLLGLDEYSLAWFEGSDGNLKYFHLYNSTSDGKDDKAFVNGEFANFNSWRARPSTFYSTMLVKDYQPSLNGSVTVSEPPSYALFLMFPLFANVIRLNKQKQK